jgi:hypothetical protein
MDGVHDVRIEPTQEFELSAARAWLHVLDTVLNTVFNRLVVACLEVQVLDVLEGAPVATVEMCAFYEIYRPRNDALI